MKQEMMGWQWHQLDHMQIIRTFLQTRQHLITQFFTGQMLFLTRSQQRQSTEGKRVAILHCELFGTFHL